MGRHPPPPDWHSLDERELEHLYVGDEDTARGALVELRQRYGGEFRTKARCLCGGNAGLKAEAAQELDARLWEKRKSYQPGKGRWVNWAKTLLHHIVIDLIRRQGRLVQPPAPRPNAPDSSPRDWL